MKAVFTSLIAFLQAEYSPGTSAVPYVKFGAPIFLVAVQYILANLASPPLNMPSRLNS